MLLLTDSISKEDSCWELRLRCALSLFLMAVNIKTPVVVENITLMCLRILQKLIKPPAPTSKKNKDVPVEALTTVKPYCNEVHAQAQLWLKRDPKASYEAWKKCLPIRGVSVSVRLGKSISPAPVLRALKSPLPFPYLSLFPFVCQGSMAMGSPPAKQSSAISI